MCEQLNIKEWKLLELKITQTRHPLSISDGKVSNSILKAIKNATGTSLIFPINNGLIHFVFVLTSRAVPNVGERFTKIWAQLNTSAKNFGEKWQIHQIFW